MYIQNKESTYFNVLFKVKIIWNEKLNVTVLTYKSNIKFTFYKFLFEKIKRFYEYFIGLNIVFTFYYKIKIFNKKTKSLF